jgi:hypothetical protein
MIHAVQNSEAREDLGGGLFAAMIVPLCAFVAVKRKCC